MTLTVTKRIQAVKAMRSRIPPGAAVVWIATLGLAADRGGAGQDAPRIDAIRKPTVGAIRWDAWHGAAGEPGKVVERTLGPRQYHPRLPFFARVIGPDEVEIRGDRQEIMDREIAYAKAAAIDYWAFVWYEPDTPMSLGLKHYLSSRHRQDVRFCLITECGRWGNRENYRVRIGQFVQLLRQPTYQTVMDGRPLVYLGFIEDNRLRAAWGAREAFRSAVDEFRKATTQAGLKNPCIVCMDFHPPRARDWAKSFGLDAISSYACPGGTEAGSPFSESMERARQFWDAGLATGADVVPIVSMGWDPRPRVDTPTPWHVYPNRNHFQPPTSEQTAEHLRGALDWTASHTKKTPANTVIIYAWNENDEGGWLVPTLNTDGTANTGRIEAIGRMQRTWKPPQSSNLPTP